MILAPFLEGIKQAGAQVEHIYVHDLNISPCRGCFACWTKTPGKCVQNDEMEELLPKIVSADILVFATPVYMDGMTSTMKMLLDRLIPSFNSFIEIRDGHCRHPFRNPGEERKVVLVSVSGFHELDNFDPLVVHMEAICRNMNAEFAGALLRPYAYALSWLKQKGIPVDEVFEAAQNAEFQLIQKGEMAPQDLTKVRRELIPKEELMQFVNS